MKLPGAILAPYVEAGSVVQKSRISKFVVSKQNGKSSKTAVS
jgi:hypothetical protein